MRLFVDDLWQELTYTSYFFEINRKYFIYFLIVGSPPLFNWIKSFLSRKEYLNKSQNGCNMFWLSFCGLSKKGERKCFRGYDILKLLDIPMLTFVIWSVVSTSVLPCQSRTLVFLIFLSGCLVHVHQFPVNSVYCDAASSIANISGIFHLV